MNEARFTSSDSIRASFSRAMSEMYKTEVPLYSTLLDLVSDVNSSVIAKNSKVAEQLKWTGEIERIAMERHGAIRVGTPNELATIRRLFAVMGMAPVGYYDLSVAGVPVHATAFRAVNEQSLQVSPFRVFTSLLRLELIESAELRELASAVLAKRTIFTPRAIQLIELCEAQGGLTQKEADDFVVEALETFRWHTQSTVSPEQYQQFHDQHRLIADVVAFKSPHINHLTPRTLDIDAIQAGMPKRGITPKAIIEGPPRRNCPILLRQTSFKALQEKVTFVGGEGNHTARFGEIEQRGAALTPKGRSLYDRLLSAAQKELGDFASEHNAQQYMGILEDTFRDFPDDYKAMRENDLAYFRYFVTSRGESIKGQLNEGTTLEELVVLGYVHFEPVVYEDFLPVSAAGIFQSNLGDGPRSAYGASSNQLEFQRALGSTVTDELGLYAATQQRSIDQCARGLGLNSIVV